MRNNTYAKTVWVDNRTPVNAENLNKLESAVSNLYSAAMSPSDLVEGDGVKINTTNEGCLQISTTPDTMRSESVKGIEMVSEEVVPPMPGVMYYVLGENGMLDKIMVNGVSIFQAQPQEEEGEGQDEVE